VEKENAQSGVPGELIAHHFEHSEAILCLEQNGVEANAD